MRRFKVPKKKSRNLGESETGSAHVDVQNIREKCTCGNSTRISWWWPWCVVFVTACVRIRYVMLPGNWWILHPDEIFQSVEVAFSEVYGYGIRPYEYLPAPENTSVPGEAQILKSEMYGLRSPIYPKMFTIALRVAKVLGLDQSPFMVCRMFNVAVTSLLPVTVYWFVHKLFRCRQLAFLACTLAAVEHHLVVFGTHTIVNSFISPAIFSGLTLCIPTSHKTLEKFLNREGDNKELSETDADVNANFIAKQSSNRSVHTDNKLQQNKYCSKHGPDTEMCANLCDTIRKNASCEKLKSVFIKSLGGLLLGVVCYIRPDTILFCICVLLPILFSNGYLDQHHVKSLIPSVIGGIIACLLCIADDFSWYGWGTVSPLQWLKFNILSGKASRLFGTEDIGVYLQVFSGRIYNTVLNISVAAILICSWLKLKDSKRRSREFRAIFSSFMISISVYSFAEHKETRFIHNVIVLYVVLVSYGIHTLSSIFTYFKKPFYSSLVTSSFVLIFTTVSYYQCPSIDSSSISRWTYGSARASNDVNTCLDWLRRQDDVKGVHVDASLYDTAGFSIFKHDVPLLIKIHHEYYLFETERRGSPTRKNSRLRIVRDFSDFIHESNKVYLTKIISRSTTFNYVITKRDAFSLIDTKYSFNKVFTYRQFNVFYRNFSSSKEHELQKLSETIPFGENATVLEYESNWLITNALYRLAIERTEQAMEIDDSRVRLFQQMFVCYSKLNDINGLYFYQEKCFSKFGKDECIKKHEKVVLHEHYSKFDAPL